MQSKFVLLKGDSPQDETPSEALYKTQQEFLDDIIFDYNDE